MKILMFVVVFVISFNVFSGEKQNCAGIAHSLNLHKEAKVYLDSVTKEVQDYYQIKGLPDNEINLLIADIVYSPISEIKRMATMLRLSNKNAANMSNRFLPNRSLSIPDKIAPKRQPNKAQLMAHP